MPPPLIPRDAKNLLFALPLCHNSNLSLRCLLRLMPIMAWILLRSLASHQFPYVSVLWCLISTFRFPCGCYVQEWRLNHLGLNYFNPFGACQLADICASWCWSVAHVRSVPSGCYLTAAGRGSLMLLSCHPAIQPI